MKEGRRFFQKVGKTDDALSDIAREKYGEFLNSVINNNILN